MSTGTCGGAGFDDPCAVCAVGPGVSPELREVFGAAVRAGLSLRGEAGEGDGSRGDEGSFCFEYRSAHTNAPATEVRSRKTNGDLAFRFPGAGLYSV